ncbi:MAG: GNAT family N-acetyltransferase [Propionicimonas sp.]|uniref:GNAT family N-acetyltransferase n=1 Tax=Propionicimonas sp. TaxID=1955623 RepID=UPI003D0E7C80
MTAEVRVRAARAEEAAALSDLALRSKGHWGYPAEFLEACRAELTLTAQECASGDVLVAERDGVVLGFAALGGTAPAGRLDALFVDPPAIGTGVGRLLLEHALAEACRRGFATVTLDADPGAAPFYAKHGGVRTGTAPSGSIAGRDLPVFTFELDVAR